MYFKSRLSYILQISAVLFMIGLFIPVGIVNGILTTQWFGVLIYTLYSNIKKLEIQQFKKFKKNMYSLYSGKRGNIFYKMIMESAVPTLIIAMAMIAIGNILIYIA